MSEPNENQPPYNPPPASGDAVPPPPPQDGAQQQPPPPPPPEAIPYASPGTYSGSGAPPYAGPAPTQDDRNLAMLAHILGIFTSFLGPLIVWLVRKDHSPFVDDQGKEALNFQLTLMIGYVISAVTTVICIGPFIAIGLSVIAIVFGIMAAVAASKGDAYRYPVNIRFIK